MATPSLHHHAFCLVGFLVSGWWWATVLQHMCTVNVGGSCLLGSRHFRGETKKNSTETVGKTKAMLFFVFTPPTRLPRRGQPAPRERATSSRVFRGHVPADTCHKSCRASGSRGSAQVRGAASRSTGHPPAAHSTTSPCVSNAVFWQLAFFSKCD